MALAEGLDKSTSAFPVGVGLDGVVAHQGWREAREHLLGLLAGGGDRIVALVGLTGTGKTLLLREVARTLRAEGRRVALLDRPDLDAPNSPSLPLPDAAEGLREEDRADVLLVDEAGRMDDDALERLGRSGATCVLAGLPGLAARLKRRGIAAETVDLPPMDVDEVARFVAARLATAGRRRDLLSPGAVLELTAQSGGIPRLVNMLAGTAVFLASLEGAREVDGRHVLDAASLRAGEQVEPQTPTGTAPVPRAATAPAAGDEAAQAPARVQAPSAPPSAPAPIERRSRRAAIHPVGGSPAGSRSKPRSPAGPTEIAPPAEVGAEGRPSAGPTGAARAFAGPPASRPFVARLSALGLPARRSPRAWIAGALCLVAVGLWLLPGPARRDPAPSASAIPSTPKGVDPPEGRPAPLARTGWAPKGAQGEADGAATPPAAVQPPSPAGVAEVPQAPAPGQPPAADPAPVGAPAPQAPPRARIEDAAARVVPVPPRPRPEPLPPSPEATDLPIASAPPRVVMHAQPGSATTEAGRMAVALEREFGAIELRAVPSSPRTPTVRYFYAEDAPAARRLAGALAGGGEGWRVQYLGTFRPLPRRGTIEVWVP